MGSRRLGEALPETLAHPLIALKTIPHSEDSRT
jgi:hypothetical protein